MRTIDKFWLTWFTVSFLVFLTVEVWALASGRPDRTLSEAVWRLEEFKNNQSIWNWSAIHYWFMGAFSLTNLWLFFHFGWGRFR